MTQIRYFGGRLRPARYLIVERPIEKVLNAISFPLTMVLFGLAVLVGLGNLVPDLSGGSQVAVAVAVPVAGWWLITESLARITAAHHRSVPLSVVAVLAGGGSQDDPIGELQRRILYADDEAELVAIVKEIVRIARIGMPYPSGDVHQLAVRIDMLFEATD